MRLPTIYEIFDPQDLDFEKPIDDTKDRSKAIGYFDDGYIVVEHQRFKNM